MDSDDDLTLSSSTMDALKAFYAERDENARRLADLKAAAESGAGVGAGAGADEVAETSSSTAAAADAATTTAEPKATRDKPLSMALFTEDWGESQFWYADETATLLARQLLDGAGPDTLIAVVSTPSVFIALKNLLAQADADSSTAPPKLLLLEHDYRFAVFPEFCFYDFNQPTKLPAHLRSAVDRVIVDPPFLSEDCQTKFALTVRWLGPEARVVVCTGERLASLVTDKLYKSQGVRATTYEPVHHGLKNEFYCYANFACADWTWRE